MCSFQGTSDNWTIFYNFFGGYKAVARPDTIPNSAVKRSLADGSSFIDSARVGYRQIFLKKPKCQVRFGFFVFGSPRIFRADFGFQPEREYGACASPKDEDAPT